MSSTRSSSRALGRRSKAEDHDDQRGTKRPRRTDGGSSSSGGGIVTAPPPSSMDEEEDLGIVSMSEPEGWEEEDEKPAATVLAAGAAAAVEAADLEQQQELRDEDGEEASTPTKRRQPPTSKFKGVCWNKHTKKWEARISFDGKMRYLGLYLSEDEAAKAVDEFVRKHDLVDSRGLNHPTTAEQAQRKYARKGKYGKKNSSRFIGFNKKRRRLGHFDSEEEAQQRGNLSRCS